VVKPNGISTTLLKLPKRVRHIPTLYKNATTHVIKSLSIASPQFLIVPRCLNVRLDPLRPALHAPASVQAVTDSNSQPSSVKLVANRFEI